jgi:hypothetical protein
VREHETKHITKTKLKCVAKEHKSLEPCALFHHPFCHHVRAHTHTHSLSHALLLRIKSDLGVGWVGLDDNMHVSTHWCHNFKDFESCLPPICITIRAQEDLIACAQSEHVGLRSPMALPALEKQNKGV